MTEMEIHNPFQLPDPYADEDPVYRPRWWYAQQLRMAGASWEEVAASLGYSSAQSAQTVVRKSRKKIDTETLDDIVDLECERLDMLQLICWKDIQDDTKDRYKAMQTILAIMTLRMRLTGTEKKAQQDVSATTNNTAVFIGGSTEDFIAGLRRVREASKLPKTIEAKPA